MLADLSPKLIMARTTNTKMIRSKKPSELADNPPRPIRAPSLTPPMSLARYSSCSTVTTSMRYCFREDLVRVAYAPKSLLPWRVCPS